jgi:hypothetical protein
MAKMLAGSHEVVKWLAAYRRGRDSLVLVRIVVKPLCYLCVVDPSVTSHVPPLFAEGWTT